MQGYNIFSVLNQYFSESRAFGTVQILSLLFFIGIIVLIYFLMKIPKTIQNNIDKDFAELVMKRADITPEEKDILLMVGEISGIKPFYRMLISRRAFKETTAKYTGKKNRSDGFESLEELDRVLDHIKGKLFK